MSDAGAYCSPGSGRGAGRQKQVEMKKPSAVAELESARQLEVLEGRHTVTIAQQSSMPTMQLEKEEQKVAEKLTAEMICTEVCILYDVWVPEASL